MSEYFSYLLYLLTHDHSLLLAAVRLKPTPEQSDALKYWHEDESKPVLANILANTLGKNLEGMEVLKVQEIFEVIDIK